MTLIGAAPATAQTRTIDLTGRPAATISEPVSGFSEGAELASGKFVFVDGREVAIRLADFSADALRVLSRTGAGPGEYRLPSDAMADGKGGAVVADQMLARAVFISGTGEVTGTGLTREEAGMAPIDIRGFDALGRVYRTGRAGAAGRDSLPIERWDPTTKTVTILAWQQVERAHAAPMRKGPDGRMSADIVGPPAIFPTRSEWMPLSDGSVAIVYQSPYRVEVISPAGKRIRGPAVKYQPIKVTSAYRAWWSTTQFPAQDDMFPAVLPPVDGLMSQVLASTDGELWVPRLRDWNDSLPKYDIFDKTGTLTGRALLKPHSKVIGFGRGAIYVARQSPDDDFWHLEKYQARP
ncbi:MAG: hypothetical protein IPJ11_03900 [Gemmatimonadetes bacterium]|nr:hypothetical protein [Gemmatimonadota bacterium]